ncbi:MAG: AbrB/MazE/SpoVT family DNA-binding domain-containing protein [Deltaproteobacteria bacterium]|nr:AbrB/MazE/SpoVT family DNA-binding domain-containing protein [Deltaproteobacteria bacterium]
MLAKLTAKNQITIPKQIIEQIPETRYFDVTLNGETVVMKPVTIYDTDLEQIRSKIKKLGLKPDCVAEAIKWARSR